MNIFSIYRIIFVAVFISRSVSSQSPSKPSSMEPLNIVNIIQTEGCTPIVLSIGYPNGPDNLQEFLKLHPSSTSTFGKEPHIFYSSLSSDLKWAKPLQRPLLKNTKNCIISIISLQDVQEEIFQSLAKTLIPEFNPVLHKDSDRVIFLSTQNLDQITILKSEDFGKKLKHKVGLSISSKNYQIFSSCEFCRNSEKVFQVGDEHLVDWPDYEENFQGSLVQLSAPSTVAPRYNFKADPKGTYYTTNGVVTYQMRFIQRKLNFTYELKPPAKAIPGVFINGSWNGVVAEVLSGRADIGVCIAQEPERCTAARCSSPIFREPVTFVTGRPQKIFVWYAIFWSFSPLVWILLVVSSILFALLLALMITIHRDSTTAIKWPLGRIFEYTFGAFLGQTGFFPQRLPSTIRVSLAMWLFCTFIIGTYYLTKLIGFLTFPVVENIPETANELVHSKYKWGITYLGGALFQLFKGSKDPVFVTISETMELLKWRDCIDKASKGRFICISYEVLPKFVTSTSPVYLMAKPPYIISEKSLFTMDVGLLTQKRAIFLPNLEKAIGNFISAGLNSEWEKQDFRNLENLRRKNVKPGTLLLPEVEEDNSLLSMKHLQGAFATLIAGLGFACFMAIFEFYIGHKARKSKRRKTMLKTVMFIKLARTWAKSVK